MGRNRLQISHQILSESKQINWLLFPLYSINDDGPCAYFQLAFAYIFIVIIVCLSFWLICSISTLQVEHRWLACTVSIWLYLPRAVFIHARAQANVGCQGKYWINLMFRWCVSIGDNLSFKVQYSKLKSMY